jgi:hypothetical protein
VPAASRGQHQDRHGDARVPPAPQHREAVHFRQSEIEHDRVVMLRLPQEIGALPVRGTIHGIPGLPERVRELPGQPCFILDDQHSH